MPRVKPVDARDIATLLNVVQHDDDIESLRADEHLRHQLYVDALSRAQPDRVRQVLAIVSRDPDRAMAEAAVVRCLDDAGSRLKTAGEYRRWYGAFNDLVRELEFARKRAHEWLLFKELQEGSDASSEQILESSDWLQRKLSAETTSTMALEVLAGDGRTKRIRHAATRRLDAK